MSSTTPKVIRMGQGQFHYIDQVAALISVHDNMREIEKLCVDALRKLEKSKTNFTSKASIPLRAYEVLKDELEKCRKLIRTFGRKYMEKMGV
jgi:4-diphosphocytidyl-2C-methyl-D-erythritol kinase